MTHGAPDRLILRWLARRTAETASGIGAAYGMTPGEVRAQIVALGSRRFITSRLDRKTIPSRRAYCATGEGRRAAWIVDERRQDW